MTVKQRDKNKRKIVISSLFFISLWFFLSNSSPFGVKYKEIFPNIPKIEINLANDFLTGFAILFPFLSLIALNILIFFYYSNFISRKSSRRILKIILILFLLSIFYLTVTIPSRPMNEAVITNSTSTTMSTTISDNTTIISNITELTTSTTQKTNPVPPKIIPPSWLNDIINFLSQNLLFIIVITGVFFVIINGIRPSVPIEIKNVKKITKSESKNKDFRDKPRKHIIANYLYVSKILENLGANKDFSLTPIEFQVDVEENKRLNIGWKDFPELTFWYEVARFSDEKIPEIAIQQIDLAIMRLHKILEDIYDNKNNP